MIKSKYLICLITIPKISLLLSDRKIEVLIAQNNAAINSLADNVMNIQIIGTKGCNDTRKAERFFKERKVQFQFRDLNEKGLAKGELDNISRVYSLEDLIDREGKQFKRRNMQYMKFDIEEELLNDPLLFKTPIVRNGKEVTLGYQPEVWKKWLEEK